MNLENISNSMISSLIDEYIHNAVYRDILKDRLINDLTFSELSKKYGFSERHTKRIVYKTSEKLFSKIS